MNTDRERDVRTRLSIHAECLRDLIHKIERDVDASHDNGLLTVVDQAASTMRKAAEMIENATRVESERAIIDRQITASILSFRKI